MAFFNNQAAKAAPAARVYTGIQDVEELVADTREETRHGIEEAEEALEEYTKSVEECAAAMETAMLQNDLEQYRQQAMMRADFQTQCTALTKRLDYLKNRPKIDPETYLRLQQGVIAELSAKSDATLKRAAELIAELEKLDDDLVTDVNRGNHALAGLEREVYTNGPDSIKGEDGLLHLVTNQRYNYLPLRALLKRIWATMPNVYASITGKNPPYTLYELQADRAPFNTMG